VRVIFKTSRLCGATVTAMVTYDREGKPVLAIAGTELQHDQPAAAEWVRAMTPYPPPYMMLPQR